MITGTASNTWWVQDHDKQTIPSERCELRELDHFGELGTGHIWCSSHGVNAGCITYADVA